MTKDPDDSQDITPIEPAIRRSSSKNQFGLTTCPKCDGLGEVYSISIDDRAPEPCDLCEGGRKVTLSVATEWILTSGHALDSSNPPPPLKK